MKDKPLYYEIFDRILDNIKDGIYAENSLLPSERVLCDVYHVSRSTVRQSLIVLEKQGHIYKVQGKGTFVKPKNYEQDLGRFYSFSEEIKKYNTRIDNYIIGSEIICLNSELCEKLKVHPNERFHKIIRLRSVNKIPLMIDINYLPQSRFYHIDVDMLKMESLYAYLSRNYNIKIDKSVETLKPCLPKTNESRLLNISTKLPCTLLERFSYEGDNIIEYTSSIVRGDKYTFKVALYNT
jgi:GntR family transcriptional regulator